MKTTAELHAEAMELAETAWIKRQEGDFAAYKRLVDEAYEKERAAAESVISARNLEPTRSVLFRSAASLALEF